MEEAHRLQDTDRYRVACEAAYKAMLTWEQIEADAEDRAFEARRDLMRLRTGSPRMREIRDRAAAHEARAFIAKRRLASVKRKLAELERKRDALLYGASTNAEPAPRPMPTRDARESAEVRS